MKDKIANNFYCSADCYRDGKCLFFMTADSLLSDKAADCSECNFYHCKHLTPEQFLKKYGREVSDDFPVWWRWWFWNNQECTEGYWEDWRLCRFGDLPEATKTRDPYKCQIVVACTPFGEPDKNWRP